jgi:hypothetical protein
VDNKSCHEWHKGQSLEAKEARNECSGISSINIVPLADELRECLERMVAGNMDEDLIEYVREELAFREEQDREYQNRLNFIRT